MTFDQTSDLTGLQLIVASDDTVAMIDPATGSVLRAVASSGSPRSVFDLVANGGGSFFVAYTFAGGSSPGTVGTARVCDHRGTLREVQAWQRNAQFGLSALAMTAFPGNQGQYLQVSAPDTGSGYSVFVTTPSGAGFYPRTTPALIANRNNVVAAHAHRTVDRRGHFALALGAAGSTPVVYVAGAALSASSVTDVFVPSVRCSEPYPAITRAVAFPDENDAAAGVCELGGLQYSVVRFGGASTGCHLFDTTAAAGRWRINDVAVMPR